MKPGRSSTSVSWGHFARTCIGQPTAGNPGQNCKPTDLRKEATNNGSQLIRPTGRGTGFNINPATGLTVVGMVCNSSGPPMAELPGRLPLLFPTDLQMERST